jgi:hypothetical protein
MAKTDTKLDWNEVDPATLQPKVAEAFGTYKEAYVTAKEFRKEFEALCTKAAELPKTHRLVFSYNFGRLSIAIDLAETKRTSSKAVSFASLKV